MAILRLKIVTRARPKPKQVQVEFEAAVRVNVFGDHLSQGESQQSASERD
jgi:hypothetical protein